MRRPLFSVREHSINFVHYDDGFDGVAGKTYTQKLVEEDKVFALVGHFGSNTVGAIVDYIEENGVPMVYGVCGVSDLYNTEKNIMTVQPIYDTEGQSMVATAFASVEAGGLAATELGVISTTDEAGKGMLLLLTSTPLQTLAQVRFTVRSPISQPSKQLSNNP